MVVSGLYLSRPLRMASMCAGRVSHLSKAETIFVGQRLVRLVLIEGSRGTMSRLSRLSRCMFRCRWRAMTVAGETSKIDSIGTV